ncbi:MAG: hypothetical protein NUV67_03480 [archaeon]|nr:hypothetical protein [archaeon]
MIYILDAAALLNSENFSFDEGNRYFTTSKVFAEWRDFRSKSLAENALSTGLLAIQDPCPLSMQTTWEKAGESGTNLGDADASIIALSMEFRGRGEKFEVITDDYSVQNVLKKMGVKFSGVAQGEIKRHKSFRGSRQNRG